MREMTAKKDAKDDPAEHRQRMESDFLKIKTAEGKLDFHALRHTCSSLLNATGTNAKVIQSHMRHATHDMTMNIYTHAETEQISH
jgi:integrase